jgi:hypothetical protein
VSVAETRYQVPVSKYRHIVFAAKVSAVGIFAVGIEFFISNRLLYAIFLFALAIVISLWPVKIDVTDDAPGARDPGEEGAGKAIHPLEEI